MKKLYAVIMAASLALFILGTAQADNISKPQSDIWTQTFVGSTNTAVAIDGDGRLNMQKGIVNVPYYYSDLAAKGQVKIYQGLSISSDTLINGGTTYITANLTQPVVPRNIVVYASITLNGDAISTANVTGTAIVYGINAVGISTHETLAIVSTANATAGLGNVAWSKISSITVDMSVLSTGSIAGAVLIQMCVGTHDKIGLFNHVISTGDIIKVIDNGADSTTYVINPTFGTITFGSTPNGSIDFLVEQAVKQTP